MPHKILVAQGGGPTAVINQSLAGVALEARRFPEVTHVYGALQGVRGIVNDDLVDLGQETVANLEAVAATPAAALGSTRDKPDRQYCQEIFKVLKAHAIDTFFYIGGNDSSDTVRIVAEEAKKSGHGLRAIHIPKTIDNDLVGFDHTPGYPSAARFVAQAFAGANLDNLALKGVYVAVVMGRHAGFLTAASALARKYPDDGPHLIYLPERTFRRRQVPGRREGRPSSATGAASSPPPRASTTTRARRSSPSSWGKRRRTRTATSSSPAPARSPISCARK